MQNYRLTAFISSAYNSHWLCYNYNVINNLCMATRNNEGKLQGTISHRVQVMNPITERWVKIDTESGRIINHKSTKGPYKSIRRKQ